MLHFLVEQWPHIATALWGSGLIVGALIAGLVSQQRNPSMNPEEARMNQRRTKGGNIFNEYLWEMKAREERRLAKFAQRLAAPDTGETDKAIYAEEIAICQRQLDAIYSMLMMKDAGD